MTRDNARIIRVDPLRFKTNIQFSINGGCQVYGYKVRDDLSGELVKLTASPVGLKSGFFRIRESQEKVYLDPVENEDILENHPELFV